MTHLLHIPICRQIPRLPPVVDAACAHFDEGAILPLFYFSLRIFVGVSWEVASTSDRAKAGLSAESRCPVPASAKCYHRETFQ